jgi:BirA family biotin operon repressor/biotin-[acetyl-CoA-carboxylase] ligase
LPQATPAKTLGSPFIELQSVDSTNNYARTQIGSVELTGRQSPILDGTTFFAHEQYEGKGQRGRVWSSEKGANIAMSVLLNPKPLLLSQQFHLSACVAVSVFEFFKKYAGDDTAIKWPNDLYWQDRKAGGILIESIVGAASEATGQKAEEASWLWAILGIGININQAQFPDWLPNPVSLKQITGKNFNPVVLAKECCSILNRNYHELISHGFDNILASYNEHLYKRGQKVKLKKENRTFEAIIKEVTPSGKLVVKHAIEEEFNFGKLELIFN